MSNATQMRKNLGTKYSLSLISLSILVGCSDPYAGKLPENSKWFS